MVLLSIIFCLDPNSDTKTANSCSLLAETKLLIVVSNSSFETKSSTTRYPYFAPVDMTNKANSALDFYMPLLLHCLTFCF